MEIGVTMKTYCYVFIFKAIKNTSASIIEKPNLLYCSTDPLEM